MLAGQSCTITNTPPSPPGLGNQRENQHVISVEQKRSESPEWKKKKIHAASPSRLGVQVDFLPGKRSELLEIICHSSETVQRKVKAYSKPPTCFDIVVSWITRTMVPFPAAWTMLSFPTFLFSREEALSFLSVLSVSSIQPIAGLVSFKHL